MEDSCLELISKGNEIAYLTQNLNIDTANVQVRHRSMQLVEHLLNASTGVALWHNELTVVIRLQTYSNNPR